MDIRLKIFPYSELTTALSNLAFNVQPAANFAEQPRKEPLFNSLDYLKNLGCQTIVKQYPVQDPDFLAEYHTYYSKVFGKIDKYCHRLHFFSAVMASSDEDVLDFIDRTSQLAGSYLGFVTIRPVRSSPVAASIITPQPGHHFILSHDDFDVHLAGRTFKVNGTPFMQQDNAVGACAQASIWMALRTLRKKEGNSAFDPAQITSAATRFLVRGRTLPNREGLVVEQMIEAVRFAGYSPHAIWLGDVGSKLTGEALKQAKRRVYTYVESEIPVILGVFPTQNSGHAIVLIGHTWQENTNPLPYITVNIPADQVDINIHHAADWVGSFIAHNDNTGPYLMLPDMAANQAYSFDQASFAIPLLPSDVFMSGEEAEHVACRILWNMLHANKGGQSQKKYEDLVIRTYLVERHKFREWIACNPDINNEVKKYYRLKSLPKRVWITEISMLTQYNNAHSKALVRVGEILLDPTGEPNDTPFLSIHLNISAFTPLDGNLGIVVDKSADGESITLTPIINDSCYSTLCRSR